MTTNSDPAAPSSTPAPPAAPAAPESLLPTGAVPPAAPSAPEAGGDPAPPPAGEHDWLPEKFRVMAEDGKLDESASARKLAESYQALEKHKGALSQAPATPDDYKIVAPVDAEGKPIDIPGLDMEQFTADPLFKNLVAEAHKIGVSNDQLQFFVGKYLTLVPDLLKADQQLSLEEAKTELQGLWKDDVTMQRNLNGVVLAINGFGAEADDVPGSRARLMQKYGRDPDFIAFAASVAQEMKEDRVPVAGPAVSELDIEALQKSQAYWDAKHPEHAATKAKVEQFYIKKFGNAPRGRRA